MGMSDAAQSAVRQADSAARTAGHRRLRHLDAYRANGLVRSESRDSVDRAPIRHGVDRPAMGGQRLHYLDRSADGHGRTPVRHLRAPQDHRMGARDIRGDVRGLRRFAERDVADHGPRGPWRRRGAHLPGSDRRRIGHVHRSTAAPRDRCRSRLRRDRHRPRAIRRRGVLEYWSWRGVFFINIPFCLAAIF